MTPPGRLVLAVRRGSHARAALTAAECARLHKLISPRSDPALAELHAHAGEFTRADTH